MSCSDDIILLPCLDNYDIYSYVDGCFSMFLYFVGITLWRRCPKYNMLQAYNQTGPSCLDKATSSEFFSVYYDPRFYSYARNISIDALGPISPDSLYYLNLAEMNDRNLTVSDLERDILPTIPKLSFESSMLHYLKSYDADPKFFNHFQTGQVVDWVLKDLLKKCYSYGDWSFEFLFTKGNSLNDAMRLSLYRNGPLAWSDNEFFFEPWLFFSPSFFGRGKASLWSCNYSVEALWNDNRWFDQVFLIRYPMSEIFLTFINFESFIKDYFEDRFQCGTMRYLNCVIPYLDRYSIYKPSFFADIAEVPPRLDPRLVGEREITYLQLFGKSFFAAMSDDLVVKLSKHPEGIVLKQHQFVYTTERAKNLYFHLTGCHLNEKCHIDFDYPFYPHFDDQKLAWVLEEILKSDQKSLPYVFMYASKETVSKAIKRLDISLESIKKIVFSILTTDGIQYYSKDPTAFMDMCLTYELDYTIHDSRPYFTIEPVEIYELMIRKGAPYRWFFLKLLHKSSMAMFFAVLTDDPTLMVEIVFIDEIILKDIIYYQTYNRVRGCSIEDPQRYLMSQWEPSFTEEDGIRIARTIVTCRYLKLARKLYPTMRCIRGYNQEVLTSLGSNYGSIQRGS